MSRKFFQPGNRGCKVKPKLTRSETFKYYLPHCESVGVAIVAARIGIALWQNSPLRQVGLPISACRFIARDRGDCGKGLLVVCGMHGTYSVSATGHWEQV